MNKLPSLIVLIEFVLLASSCGKEYTLHGNTGSYFNGSKAYLKVEVTDEWKTLDSCEILHGKFCMRGPADSTFVTALFIGEEAIIPVVVEEGEITLDINRHDITIDGTELNNALSTFMQRKSQFERRMYELERLEASLILDGHTAESAALQMEEQFELVGDSLDTYVESFIKEHYNTVLGPCVFQLLCSSMPYPLMTKQVEELLSGAPESFLSDEYVKSFIAAAEENKRRMSEQE